MEKIVTFSQTARIDVEGIAFLSRAVDAVTLPDLLRQIDSGVALCFVGRDDSGRVVCAFALRVDRLAAGADGVILACAGAMPGARLMDFFPVAEARFSGVSRLRVHTRRPGMVRELLDRGYRLMEFVLVKPS